MAAVGNRVLGGTGDHPRDRELSGGALIPRSRRAAGVAIGVVLIGAYLAVLAWTVGNRTDDTRPLYDGFAPVPTYRWMDPPAFFASGNVEPTPVSATVKLGLAGSSPAGIATPDGQFVISLGRGAIPASSGAERVRVKITPVEPGQLAKVSPGLRPNGNAYRVDMTYEPTGAKVRGLARPGTLVMEIPELGKDLFFSANGARWSQVASRTVPPRQLSLTATFASPGDYLAATNLPELVDQGGSTSDHAVLIGVVTSVLTAILLVVAFVLVRRRRRGRGPEDPAPALE